MNHLCVVLSLGAILVVATAMRFTRQERVLLEVPMQRDTLRVVATDLHEIPGGAWPDSSVEMIRFMDRRGNVQFSDSMMPYVDAEGLREEVSVDAYPITFDGGRGVILRRMFSPSDPTYEGDCRYFALRGKTLAPVSPWCGACGDLLPGNRAKASLWMSWFRAYVPFVIHFERLEGGLEIVADKDSASGLASLEIDKDPGRYYEDPDTVFTVRLFRAPVGEASDSVVVSAATKVIFGRLYAELMVDQEAERQGEFDAQVRRLEVTIDNHHGYVAERDFPALGLREAG